MKLLVINPNTSPSMTTQIGLLAMRAARTGTDVTCMSPDFGPRSIEGHVEEAIAAAATLEVVARERDAFDAFVIACFGDPGLSAARELTSAPVVGIAEAAMLLSTLVAHRFSIVTVIPRVIPLLEDLVRRNHLEGRCASIRATGLSVLELEQDWDRAEELMIAEAAAAVQNDGAEAICLGCAGMGTLHERMVSRLDVPVLEGVAAAVTLAEALHSLGLRTAKRRAYRAPEPKEYLGGLFPQVAMVSAPGWGERP
jgi:allantoin racemase